MNMLREEAIQRTHAHLLRHYRKLGMAHEPCEVPECNGYTPAEKKSMLEDWETFITWQETCFKVEIINRQP